MPDLLRCKKQWWRIRDLEAEFGLSRSTCYELAAAGTFGAPVQLGGTGSALLFHRSDVLRAIERSREKMAEDLGIVPD